jgi:hypothetical protein
MASHVHTHIQLYLNIMRNCTHTTLPSALARPFARRTLTPAHTQFDSANSLTLKTDALVRSSRKHATMQIYLSLTKEEIRAYLRQGLIIEQVIVGTPVSRFTTLQREELWVLTQEEWLDNIRQGKLHREERNNLASLLNKNDVDKVITLLGTLVARDFKYTLKFDVDVSSFFRDPQQYREYFQFCLMEGTDLNAFYRTYGDALQAKEYPEEWKTYCEKKYPPLEKKLPVDIKVVQPTNYEEWMKEYLCKFGECECKVPCFEDA